MDRNMFLWRKINYLSHDFIVESCGKREAKTAPALRKFAAYKLSVFHVNSQSPTGRHP